MRSHPLEPIDLERSLLGTLIIDPAAADDVWAIVQPESFCTEAHRVVAAALLSLWKEGKDPSLPVLADRIAAHGHLDEIGGYIAIAQLAEHAGFQSAAEAEARRVQELHCRRKIVELGNWLASEPEGIANGRFPQICAEAAHRIAELVRSSGALPPKPLRQERPELPPFPVHCFPPWLREYVEAVAWAVAAPVEAPAMHALAMLSVALGGKYKIHVGGEYREALQFYGICIMATGERKTSVIDMMLQPLRDADKRAKRQAASRASKAKFQAKVLKKRMAKAELAASKGDGEFAAQEYAELDIQLQEAEAALQMPASTNVTSATVEAITKTMVANQGRCSIIVDEGGTLQNLCGLYSGGSGSNVDVLLHGYNNSQIAEARASDDSSRSVPRACLTVSLNVQKSRLLTLVSVKDSQDLGLLSRFCYSIPKSMVGERPSTFGNMIDPRTKREYHESLASLFDIPMPTEAPHSFSVSPEARELIESYRAEIEPQLKEDTGALHPIGDWAKKFLGLAVRIAGLLHCAQYAGLHDPHQYIADSQVSPQTVAQAREIADYFLAHATEAYRIAGALGTGPEGDAKKIVDWYSRKALVQFTARDAFRSFRKTMDKERLEAALDSLVVNRWLEYVEVPRSHLGAYRILHIEAGP